LVNSAFESVSYRATSRRASILGFGGAALAAALAAPKATRARKKKGKSPKVRCGKSRSQCRASMTLQCELNNPDPEVCIEYFVPCCDLLTDSTFDPFLACLFDD
jgi:hypothetical protein